jgi:hypothetical protein
LWVACEAVQHVTWPSFTCATAQDGPIEPCVWIAKSYVVDSRRLACAKAWDASPTLLVTASWETGVART